MMSPIMKMDTVGIYYGAFGMPAKLLKWTIYTKTMTPNRPYSCPLYKFLNTLKILQDTLHEPVHYVTEENLMKPSLSRSRLNFEQK